MENQRLLLFAALVFVLFLLWQNWLEFQAKKHPPPPPTVAAATVGSNQAGKPAAAPGQDIPTAASMAGAPTGLQGLSSGQRVHVTTDLFEAEIDAIGGDLRKVGLRTYPESVQQPDHPFLLLNDSSAEVFIAQSGLLAEDQAAAPNHYATFVPEQTDYRLTDGQDSLEVRLLWSDPSGLKVVKTYTFHRGSFLVDLNQRVENGSPSDWRGSQYRQFQRTPPLKTNSYFGGGVVTYTGAVVSTPQQRYEKIAFDQIAKQPLSESVQGGWVAMIQHYFLGAWVPGPDETDTFYTRVVGGNRYVVGMTSAEQTVAPSAAADFRTRLYVGPKLPNVLESIAPNLQLTVDYGTLTIIAEPLFWLLKAIHAILGNWGWAIIFLTILIKLAFYKLSETSYRSMANMRRLAPELSRLKELYGDDKQKMNEAMMGLYKREKVNPLGGCLPILVQIPVFIALYWVLAESVQLRQAPFMFWIRDLAIPDPYYVLPLIMGVTMFVQQKLSPAPPDPVQAKVMMALPIVFTFMFLWFPAGLVLYWVVNNMLSIAQQWVITKRVESGADAVSLKAKEGSGLGLGLGEQAKKLLTLAKQALPDQKNLGKRKKK
ncbi:MAG TPA: membrane protein insertase YidC [Candidatus Competibacteraceae bacterium]|nr:membrane protein insertase YidC [Candidatus Competibacteraceae bacterium]HQA25657.1 membrane protein insertase YidC [Candidatus Competibacteraceae bacterium]HQD56648.1 membrane protein insertase YidC [Candidatus Competibacteraceae bacterium]